MSLQTVHEKHIRFMEDLAKRQKKDVYSIVRESAFPYLPAKSLLRFRCVCRDWNFIITSPFFTHNQSHSFRNMSGLFNQSVGCPPSFISLDNAAYGVPDPSLSFLPVPVEIKSSSNGLLCCQGRTDQKLYYICNPVNKEWKVLPKPSCNHGSDPSVVLIFESSLLNFAADYKVVCAIPSTEFDGAIEFEIYSSEKRSWKVSREICFNEKVQSGTGLYMNNMIYWPTSRGILSFNPISEHAVSHGSYGVYGRALVEMCGQLCYASMVKSKLTVYLADLYMSTQPMSGGISLHGPTPKLSVDVDKEIMRSNSSAQVLPSVGGDVLVIKAGGTIASYHIYKKEFKVLSTGHDYLNGKYVPYVNSLVSVSSV